jgi:phosphoribosylformylglycinamidine cyclo-ligase/phosphoribosylamine--glycine ligase/phosphoribosylformylglycinamidine cyclo-ligase
MHRVFNMGIGMVCVVAPEDVAGFQARLGWSSWIVGEVVDGAHAVSLL